MQQCAKNHFSVVADHSTSQRCCYLWTAAETGFAVMARLLDARVYSVDDFSAVWCRHYSAFFSNKHGVCAKFSNFPANFRRRRILLSSSAPMLFRDNDVTVADTAEWWHRDDIDVIADWWRHWWLLRSEFASSQTNSPV